MALQEEHMPDEKRLRELLVGRKVVQARMVEECPDPYSTGPTGYLTLDNGTVLKVWGNDGGCACFAGCYPLTELNTCDNGITNVQVDASPSGDDEEGEGYYRIFVLAEDKRYPLASFEGDDGNGYYGTGWWIQVSTEGNHD